MNYKALSNPEKWILKGIPILFIIGSLLHFMYDLSGNNFLVGLVTAVNESVWEHAKMVLLPVILWWSLYYLYNGKRYDIDRNQWYTGADCITDILIIDSYAVLFLYGSFWYRTSNRRYSDTSAGDYNGAIIRIAYLPS